MSGAMEPVLISLADYGNRARNPHGPTRRRRRNGSQPQQLRNVYEAGHLRIDFDAYEVFLYGRMIHVFAREFEILRFLVQFPNRVFTRANILESGRRKAVIDPRTVDRHVHRLRTRIERDPIPS